MVVLGGGQFLMSEVHPCSMHTTLSLGPAQTPSRRVCIHFVTRKKNLDVTHNLPPGQDLPLSGEYMVPYD